MKKTAKYIEDEPSPVSYSKLNISLHNIRDYRILFGLIRSYWLDNFTLMNISTQSKLILNSLPLLSFVPAFLQVWTLCRYGELKQIKIQSIKKRKELEIRSSKGEHVRLVPAVPFSDSADLKSIKDKTKIQVVSYDSYKDSISRVLFELNILFDEGILNRSHIFRHLEATFLSNRGVPIEKISYMLGHITDSSTSEYIHEDWRV